MAKKDVKQLVVKDVLELCHYQNYRIMDSFSKEVKVANKTQRRIYNSNVEFINVIEGHIYIWTDIRKEERMEWLHNNPEAAKLRSITYRYKMKHRRKGF